MFLDALNVPSKLESICPQFYVGPDSPIRNLWLVWDGMGVPHVGGMRPNVHNVEIG